MKKLFSLALFLVSTQASASLLVEDFSSLSDWQEGWLTANSNLTNYYAANGGTVLDRGNNPDGLWLDDGDNSAGADHSIDIIFKNTFASAIQLLSLDLANHAPGSDTIKIDIFDSSWNTIFSSYVPPTYGALSNPGIYQNFTVSSASGIGGFTLRSANYPVEGNISVDNIVVATAEEPVPVAEPGTFLLFAVGILGLLFKRRRQI